MKHSKKVKRKTFMDKNDKPIYMGHVVKVSDDEYRIVEVDGELRIMASNYKVSRSLDVLDRFDVEIIE